MTFCFDSASPAYLALPSFYMFFIRNGRNPDGAVACRFRNEWEQKRNPGRNRKRPRRRCEVGKRSCNFASSRSFRSERESAKAALRRHRNPARKKLYETKNNHHSLPSFLLEFVLRLHQKEEHTSEMTKCASVFGLEMSTSR